MGAVGAPAAPVVLSGAGDGKRARWLKHRSCVDERIAYRRTDVLVVDKQHIVDEFIAEAEDLWTDLRDEDTLRACTFG